MTIEARIHDAKILLIDDDTSVARDVSAILHSVAYANVRVVTDLRLALTYYQEFKPDLTLLAIKMSDFDGFQILDQLMAAPPFSHPRKGPPFVLILTKQGERNDEIRIKALRSGARDFVNKPFDEAELLARIRNLLEICLLQNELSDYNGLLEEQIKSRTQSLKSALERLTKADDRSRDACLETIYRLTLAAEYKDEDTAIHIQRMGRYAKTLAEGLNFSPAFQELIYHASPMHDIGKIGIPDKILLKPGPLNAQEWEIMKTHTTIGGKILQDSKEALLKNGEIIALNHHERWDGTGYPKGLKGEQIPIEGRIVMLGDIYDALRSRRPYKEPFDHEKSVSLILEGDDRTKPVHFDPKVLNVFRRNEREFEKIFNETQ